MNKKVRISAIALTLCFTLVGLYLYHHYIAGSTVPEGLKGEYIYIPSHSSYEEVIEILREKDLIKNEATFHFLAERMNYKRQPMRSGRYEVKPGWNMVKLIRHLRSGEQAAVRVVLSNERLPEDVAAKVARFIEADSSDLINAFYDPAFLEEQGHTKETIMTIFIPNTYEVYWNIRPEVFVKRMLQEHTAFWKQQDRRKKAEKLGLSPAQVYTLASIVEKETLQNSEKPRVAGVYINRLNQGIRLQADPTCVFATRDFETPRVTNYHLEFDSPYNTYMYAGLPPGPISMCSISSIDAVLDSEEHDYVYFCAKGDGSGFHSFAKTLTGHNRNAATYRANLRKRGLR